MTLQRQSEPCLSDLRLARIRADSSAGGAMSTFMRAERTHDRDAVLALLVDHDQRHATNVRRVSETRQLAGRRGQRRPRGARQGHRSAARHHRHRNTPSRHRRDHVVRAVAPRPGHERDTSGVCHRRCVPGGHRIGDLGRRGSGPHQALSSRAPGGRAPRRARTLSGPANSCRCGSSRTPDSSWPGPTKC